MKERKRIKKKEVVGTVIGRAASLIQRGLAELRTEYKLSPGLVWQLTSVFAIGLYWTGLGAKSGESCNLVDLCKGVEAFKVSSQVMKKILLFFLRLLLFILLVEATYLCYNHRTLPEKVCPMMNDVAGDEPQPPASARTACKPTNYSERAA